MECVLHIGSAKTGSSALQSVLYDARSELLDMGWKYPESCLWHSDRSHNLLAIYFWDNFLDRLKRLPFEEVLDNLLSEARQAPNLLISSEILEKCALRSHENFAHFIDHLQRRNYRIRIVYVVRRQDFFLDSQFKQVVRDPDERFHRLPADFVNAYIPNQHYSKVAQAWRNIPGVAAVDVIPYLESKTELTFATLFAHFGFSNLSARAAQIPRVNASLDGNFLRLKHFLNRFDPPMMLQTEFNQKLFSETRRLARSKKLTLFSPQTRQALLDLFDADARQLETDFGVTLAGWSDQVAPATEIFEPIAEYEIPSVLTDLAEISPSLADNIKSFLKL